jgi:hypothetical protein
MCFNLEVENASGWSLTGLDKKLKGKSGALLNARGQSCDHENAGSGEKKCCFHKCGEFRLKYWHSGGTVKARMNYYIANWKSDWIDLTSTRSTRSSSSEEDIIIDFHGCFGDKNKKRSPEKRVATCDAFTPAAV